MEEYTAQSEREPQLVHSLSPLRSPEQVLAQATPDSTGLPGNSANGVPEGRPVTCFPEQLQLHPALDEIGWNGRIDELSDAIRLKKQSIPVEPILVTTNNTVIAGFGRWRLALREPTRKLQCIEYAINDSAALQFILAYHQPARGWNDFVRIRLALTQKPDLQQKALANMRAGGKCKGFTNLSEADRINVCQQIAYLAGTGTTNVGKVETILRKGHPNIVAALQNGSLRIHPAWSWCKLSKLEQLDKFAGYEERRTQRKILQEFSSRHTRAFQLSEVIDVLQRVEARKPGCIIIRNSRSKRTVLILGEDYFEAIGG